MFRTAFAAAVILFSLLTFTTRAALAQSVPTVTTDQTDYPPGSTVIITGSGFTGQPLITLRVVHVPEIPPEQECAPWDHDPWYVMADAEGNFTTTWYIDPCDGDGSTFLLTADDFVTGLHAETTFTDAARLEALHNNTPQWNGNNITSGNSCYAEGGSVPFRYFVTQMTPGQNYSFVIRFQALNGSQHAYDYLTDFDRTEAARIAAAGGPCGGGPLAGSNCVPPVGSLPFPDPSVAANYAGPIPSGSGYPLSIPLDGPRNLKFYGASNLTIGQYSFGGPGNREIHLTVSFTATGTGAGFFWGGHLAKESDWGVGNGAGSTSGTSSMQVNDPNVPGGSSNPQNISVNAIRCSPPSCAINCAGTPPYVAGSTQSCSTSVAAQSYLWTVTGGTIVGSATGSSVTYTVGNSGSVNISLRTCNNPPNGSGCAPDACCDTCFVTIPILSCACTPPPDAIVQCGGDTSPASTGQVECTSGCASDFSDTIAYGMDCPQDHVYAVITRTWTCTAGSASSTCTQTITVVDTTAPEISGVGGPMTVECPDAPTFSEPVASDLCDPAPVLTYEDVITPGQCPVKHIITRTWTATDSCGNTAQASQSITVRDTQGPALNGCPSPTATYACRSLVPDPAVITAMDECDGAVTVQFSESESNPGSSCNNTIVRTWTAVDACNNSASCTQTITINDDVPPTINGVAGPLTVECESELPFSNPAVSDNCDENPALTFDDVTAPGDCAHSYTITRTWTAMDACGNTASASQTITVVDTTAPVISGQGADATIECPEVPQFTPPVASDNCDAAPQIVQVSDVTTPGNCAGTYSRTVTWKAVDACGNESGTVSQTIIVADTTPPALSGQGDNATIECPEDPSFTAPSASDNCDADAQVVLVSDVTDPGACAGTYSRTMTWKAVDCSGNESAMVSQTITVQDTTPPALVLQAAAMMVECDGAGNQNALSAWLASNGGADAADLCSDVTWSHDFTGLSDGCGSTGAATVTFTASDACGNTASTTATFTIQDTTAPAIDVFPSDVSAQCLTDISPADVSLVSAQDACSDVTIIHVGDADNGGTGCVNDPYVLQRTYRAQDACGNFVDQVQTFTIVDDLPPVIDNFPADVAAQCVSEIPAADASLISATDNCNGQVQITHLPDADNGGTGCADNPYILTRTYRISDACGNFVDQAQTFTVIDTMPPTIDTAASDMLVECDGAGNLDDLNAWLASNAGAAAVDNCSAVTWSNDFAGLSDACGSTGSVTVMFTAADACGNVASTIATFTIQDTTPPVIAVQASNQTVECDGTGNLAELDAWLASNAGAQAHDACGGVTWSHNFSALSDLCGGTGAATVTFTAADDCGNTSTTVATFTIQDTTAPVIASQAQTQIVECDGTGNLTQLNAWLASNGGASAADLCGNVTWSHNFTGLIGGCGSTGAATVTFTASDECGNTVSTAADFIIVDTTAPVISVAASSLTVECDGAGNSADLNAWLASNGGAMASDLCGTVTWSNDFVALSDACGATGSVAVVFTATDACGNASTTGAIFTIVDTTAPAMLTAAADVTVECDGAGNVDALNDWLMNFGGASASDACSGVTWSHDFAGLTPACGTTGQALVTFTATDDCGNLTSTSAMFTIVDTTAPTLADCPADISLPCNVNLHVPVSFNLPDAVDACSTVGVSASPASGSGFPVGTTIVTATAGDDCGNASQCTFTVTRAALGFEGFYHPIDGADATGGTFDDPLRTFKLGSTIPFKFKALCGGGPVLTGVHTLQAIKYSNATTSDPPIDATPTGGATSGNQFVLTGDQWHFNLNTKPLSAGTWKFIATLSDGSKHEVWLALRK